MRFIGFTLIIGIALIPLISSTLVPIGEGFIPTLSHLETDVERLWSDFKKGFNFTYNTIAEETHRFKIFIDNMKLIIKHNLEQDLGIHTYRLGVNEYAAMTNKEFREKFNGFRLGKKAASINSKLRKLHASVASPTPLPVSVDWRDQGLVTPVKDQGQCGSCWAFSTTGALEGQHARVTGKLVGLSEQQLVDCSTKWGNEGCNGGLMDNAFQYVHDNNGLNLESVYPYTAQEGQCNFRENSIGTTCDGFVDIPEGNEKALQEAIAYHGPVSVAIDASNPSFQHYVSGVYSDPNCSPDNLDHGVLVVGYGVSYNPLKGKQEYYIVKNSWSAAWGENGYIRMARNKKNMCGISSAASYPIVKDKTVQSQPVDL